MLAYQKYMRAEDRCRTIGKKPEGKREEEGEGRGELSLKDAGVGHER